MCVTTQTEKVVDPLFLSHMYIYIYYCSVDQCVNNINVFLSSSKLVLAITLLIINLQMLYVIVSYPPRLPLVASLTQDPT